jgi:two-component system chemotaxis response regulator CheY
VKILVVDDSGIARKALIKLLNEQLEGWEIIDTGDGKQAVSLFKQHKPDLTFLDLTMPEVRGEDILEEIRTFDKESKIIVVSADIQLKTRENVIALGANCMVNKPINAEKIAQALTSVMC